MVLFYVHDHLGALEDLPWYIDNFSTCFYIGGIFKAIAAAGSFLHQQRMAILLHDLCTSGRH